MWHSYFGKIQKKYSMRLSNVNPLVIRLDGKDVTKNKENIDILENYKSSFYNVMCESAKYFSKKYKCYAILGSDEISFIVTDPMLVYSDMSSECFSPACETISVFSQLFFDYFNNLYKKYKIFWHGKCFSIPEGKINSYVKHRSRIIENVLLTYFLIKENKFEEGLSIEKNVEKCQAIDRFKSVENMIKGTMYYCGDKIDLDKFMSENVVVKVEDESFGESSSNNDFNIDDFEIEI